MAIDLRRRRFAEELIGVDSEPANAAAAVRIGLVDEIVSFEECVRRSDLIVLAVPVGTAAGMLPGILDRFAVSEDGARKIVIDVCSAKEALVRAVKEHPMRSPWAAVPGLFDGRACIICNRDESDPDAAAAVENLYDVLNMRQIDMDASNHDVHTAYVSHISHITSFALALTVLDKEKNEKHIFDLASGGFSSTVRLAKSSADMWVPIFSQNRDFRNAIADGDEDSVRSLIEEANRIKRIIR